MILSLELPDTLARQLELDGPESNSRALEMFALEGYRSGKLSRGQAGELLKMGFQETEEFLHRHNAFLDLTIEDVRSDSAALSRLLSK